MKRRTFLKNAIKGLATVAITSAFLTAYGACSFTAIDTKMSHFEEIAESVKNKLFFAGEHTNVDYFSTAHGAYLGGIREANKMMNL